MFKVIKIIHKTSDFKICTWFVQKRKAFPWLPALRYWWLVRGSLHTARRCARNTIRPHPKGGCPDAGPALSGPAEKLYWRAPGNSQSCPQARMKPQGFPVSRPASWGEAVVGGWEEPMESVPSQFRSSLSQPWHLHISEAPGSPVSAVFTPAHWQAPPPCPAVERADVSSWTFQL